MNQGLFLRFTGRLRHNRLPRANLLMAATLVAVMLVLSTVTFADTYTYTGSPLGQDPSDPTPITGLTNVSGWFTISGALAPNLADTDITGLITSFSFSDGLQTITQADTFNAEDFVVNTDASGNIIGWAVDLNTPGGFILSCNDQGQVDPYPPSGYCEPGTGFGGTGDEVGTQGEVGLVVPGSGAFTTPEPSALPMLAVALAGLIGLRTVRNRLAVE